MNIKKYEKLSLIVISTLVIKTMLLYSKYIKIPTIVESVIELLSHGYILFILIRNMRMSYKRLIVFVLISIITLYTGIVTKTMVIFSSFLILCLASIIDRDKIVKVIFKTIAIVLIFHILIYFGNLFLGNEVKVAEEVERTRYYLGFTHPNISGTYTLWCFVAYAYLNKEKMSEIILGFLVVIVIYMLNQTRTMLFCSCILVILVIFTKIKGSKKIINFISKNIFFMLLITMIALIAMYSSGLEGMEKIDDIMSQRLFFSSQAIENYGLTIFGQDCENVMVKVGYYYGKIIMDVTYVSLLYNKGIIYVILLALLTRYTAKNNSTFVQIMIIVWSIFALFELYSLNFVICFPLLFGGDLIGGKNERNTEKDTLLLVWGKKEGQTNK